MKKRLLLYNSTPLFTIIKTGTGKGAASAASTITGIPTDGTVNLIVITAAYVGGGTLADTSSNVYSAGTAHTNSGVNNRIFYMVNPSVTSSMTFTLTGTFSAIAVMIATGNISSPTPAIDQQNGNSGTGTSLSSNSVTPTQNNEFIVACSAEGAPTTGTPPAVTGYTLINVAFASGVNQGLATYYQVQTTATATSVTFAGSGVTYYAASIASFIN